MKNKNLLIIALAICTASALFYSFIPKRMPEKQASASSYMMVDITQTSTTFDVKMSMIFPDGKTTDVDLENYNTMSQSKLRTIIIANDKVILDKLNQLHADGWDIFQVTHSSINTVPVLRYYLKKSQ